MSEIYIKKNQINQKITLQSTFSTSADPLEVMELLLQTHLSLKFLTLLQIFQKKKKIIFSQCCPGELRTSDKRSSTVAPTLLSCSVCFGNDYSSFMRELQETHGGEQ